MPSGYQLPWLNRQTVTSAPGPALGSPGTLATKGGPGGNWAGAPFGGSPGSTPGTYTGSIPAQPWQSNYSYPSSSIPPTQATTPYAQNTELNSVLKYLMR